jgi:VanZ family protein
VRRERPRRFGTLAAVVATRVTPWVPVVLWAGLIFAFSAVPSLGTGLGGWDLVLRKLAHFAEFAVLAALVYRASGRALVSVAAASLYAVTDEVHQLFVSGRQGSPVDWLVDTAGAITGVLVYRLVSRR